MTENEKNFVFRAQKHPFVRKYLMERDDGLCYLCGKHIRKNMQVFHATHDKHCITDKVIKIKCPTKMRPDMCRYLPDCEHCEVFYECIDGALFSVHAFCNREYNNS